MFRCGMQHPARFPLAPEKKPPSGGFFCARGTLHQVPTHSRLLLGGAGSSFVCFCFCSISGGCGSVGSNAGFHNSWGSSGCIGRSSRIGGSSSWLSRSDNSSSWLNGRHGHFFFLAASGQGESGKQGGKQKGFFHGEFSEE